MTDKHHIVRAFDRELEAVQAKIVRMGGLVEAAISEAMTALTDRDPELARKVRENDRLIDELEEEIEHDTAQIIALWSPTASDLRTVLAVMRIAGNLERVGDYAKNIAKRSEVLSEMARLESAVGSLNRMAREVEGMLKDSLDAYIQHDAELAETVRSRDSDVDQMYNAIFRELLTHMMEDPRNITGAMHLHFVAKNIERMGDHVTSIAEQVIYLVTGERPEEERKKRDRTSFVQSPES
ncbi:MAG: phosphate transport system regulatory protein PhoU [Alphaproteobacteria bacterium]|nr:MAG: phosphate transport system regulatory protein PhoU [Alphaproteobacteria bacterium]